MAEMFFLLILTILSSPKGGYFLIRDGGETDNIKGCYERIGFHSVHPQTSGHKFPIYKQIGGTFYLRIHGKKKGAPWIFADEEKNIKYE